eukprot:CAMPEP_0184494776 /NCGR_PEP_ID=MMETSP0113_2-20130426/29563_1 /TAXON_ID=91329 /ORGANISM="Norrisiella sphaerica, Strain BC52" /LENGTH=262 /DNA_ID=CAMNT_0026880669 /DNA_START=1 /DNA_END=789 /DNA_ORIENTATION=+
MGCSDVKALLRKHLASGVREISETCSLSLERICWHEQRVASKDRKAVGEELRNTSGECIEESGDPKSYTTTKTYTTTNNDNDNGDNDNGDKIWPKFSSIDPAPSGLKAREVEALRLLETDQDKLDDEAIRPSIVKRLESQFLNSSLPLFQRYRAMFGLRDVGGEEAANVLAQGFNDSSALLRHEVAFVLGQLALPSSVRFLDPILSDEQEHSMVRHEAAEALGAIATPESFIVLNRFLNHHDDLVRESCHVALDMHVDTFHR